MNNTEALSYAVTIEKFYDELQGRRLTLSMADWITIESWHRLGIPIECVLKGMDRAFTRQPYRVDSLEFCDGAVKEVCRETCSILNRFLSN